MDSDAIDAQHPDEATLAASLDHIRAAPRETGSVALIVRRPATGERETLERAELCPERGLIGDNWASRGGEPVRERMITLMNCRSTAAVAVEPSRWALAGDQFYVDFDLSDEHLPPGSRVKLGEAVLEITAEPHLGCRKFSQRFGKHAARFVNSEQGKALKLRGVNATVIEPGSVARGDTIRKLGD